MPRLFVGIGLPDGVRQALALSRGGLREARWVDPADYHATLRFVGEVEPPRAEALLRALHAVSAEPVEIEADAFGAFGGDAPRSLHLRLRTTPALSALQSSVERACRDIGLEPETRVFAPHVTLARMRRVKPREVARWLSEHIYAGPLRFQADAFSLFSARPGGGGPYAEIERFPLGAAAR